ncbi:MAG: CdaR family protein [Nitrospirota bacterium]
MKKLLFENLGLKISAVLISIFLWFFVTSRGQSEMSFDIPVEFKNIPEKLEIVHSNNKTVSVTVRGQERLMKNIRASDIRIFVDMSRAKKGEGVYFVNEGDVRMPYAMSVTNIKPSSLKIRLDESVIKTVPVKPYITGVPEEGFYVSSVLIEPKNIMIHGVRSEVRKIKELRTEALDIAGLSETIEQDLNIDIANANVKPDFTVVKVRVIIKGYKR